MHRPAPLPNPCIRTVVILALLLAAIPALLLARPVDAQATSPTTTATPQADARPDACEPNNDQAHACRLDLDAVSGPFTFLPEGDIDSYSLFLGAQPDGLETTLTLRATSGLDLYATVRRAEGGPPLATIATPAISTTLTADVTGWVVLRVENRAAGLASGQSYRIEVRRTLPPPPATTPTASGPEGRTPDPATPDNLENNYSPETAAPIAVGVLYDLNLVCPVANGCPGGDHDYLRVEVKAGMRYLISTFDLADGVDTVLDLFWWSPDAGWQLLASNDDARAGVAFLSTIRWQAPADGIALVRVGPRAGGLNPILPDAPSYRVAMALAGSPLAEQLEARVAQQTNMPTATPAPSENTSANGATTGAAPATTAPTPVVMVADGATGLAQVLTETVAHTDPDPTSPNLGTIPVDAVVQLTGRVAGLWVEVTSSQIVGAAWVDRRALRPADVLAPTVVPAISATTSATALPGSLPEPDDSVPGTQPTITMQATTTEPAESQTVPAHVTASVIQGSQPIRGLRVILMSVLDDTLSQQVTADDGTAIFDLPVTRGTQVDLVIPALGLRVPVDAAHPEVTVTLPEAN